MPAFSAPSRALAALAVAIIAAKSFSHAARLGALPRVLQDDQECNLACPIDAPCVFGSFQALHGDEVVHPVDENGNRLVDGAPESGPAAMHCQCPSGWTGLQCERMYVTCGNVEDVCYNGGRCLSESSTPLIDEQTLLCDCFGARSHDGTRYTGRHCQIPVLPSDYCDGGADPNLYCLHGGSCNTDPDSPQVCDCIDGYEGKNCEYEGNTVQECTLECENGGQCAIGIDNSDSLRDEEQSDGMYCVCPAGFGGENCEVARADCSAGNHCLNGGQCIEFRDGDEIRDHCDCTTAATESSQFTGKHCELRSTALCDNGGFCVNGGTCNEDGYSGCTCPSGYSGFRCEIDDQDQSNNDSGSDNDDDQDILDKIDYEPDQKTSKCTDELVCFNGGTCMMQDDDQYYCECNTAIVGDDKFAGSSCQYRVTTECGDGQFCVNDGQCVNDGINQCECDGPWGGEHCEIDRREIPGGDDQGGDANGDGKNDFQDVDNKDSCKDGSTCFNGGMCTETMIANGDGTVSHQYHCDCTRSQTDTERYTGVHCEYKATTFCELKSTIGGESRLEFCANGGTCKTDGSAGCDCPPAWTGLRCDIDQLDNAINDQDNNRDEDGAEDDDVVTNYNGKCGEYPCQNGGKCVLVAKDNVEYKTCDCRPATTATDVFAGQYCQYKSTSFCTQPENTGESLDGSQFCVNEGQCADNPTDDCKCPTGFMGVHCEVSINQSTNDPEDGFMVNNDDDGYNTCHLQCANGSCVKGVMDTNKMSEIIQPSEQPSPRYDDRYVEHCECVPGWTGLLCDFKVEVCGADEHYCLHGSKCVKDTDRYSCDCTRADQEVNGSTTFAGDSCEHTATEICSSGVGHAFAFCVNGGTCNAIVEDGMDHQGCTCPDGWTGSHCEVDSDISTKDKRLSVLVILVIALVALVISCSFTYAVVRRRRQHVDRDKFATPEEEVNLAPRGGEPSLDMPETDYISSSDPMISSSDLMQPPDDEPEVFIGHPRDEDGHELHNVEIL